MIDSHTDLCVRLNEIDKQVKTDLQQIRSHLIQAQRGVDEARERIKRVSDLIATLNSLRNTICKMEEKDD